MIYTIGYAVIVDGAIRVEADSGDEAIEKVKALGAKKPASAPSTRASSTTASRAEGTSSAPRHGTHFANVAFFTPEGEPVENPEDPRVSLKHLIEEMKCSFGT